MSDKYFDWRILHSTLTNTTSAAIAMNTVDRMAYEVEFPTNSTAGTMIIEWSSDASYAGVWVQIAAVAWAVGASKQGGTVLGPLGFVRARLTLQAGTHVLPFVVKIQGSVLR